ncbi:MAG: aerobic carbon-monoxide dehydrogenase large subunit, partial [Acetobacteraceae bacterium]|nr:aerobic carbon-monoxide dehydrogenase large subunit [Acetobacteraceae bacterium]
MMATTTTATIPTATMPTATIPTAAIQAKSVRRREDLRLLTGQGNYAADAAPAGMAVAIFLRSPYAHARIERIDTAAARSVPGVIGVYTGADLTDVAAIAGGIGFPRPDGGPAPKTDRPLLAGDRVRFVGEPVALVIAETRAAGQEAAEAIVVDY